MWAERPAGAGHLRGGEAPPGPSASFLTAPTPTPTPAPASEGGPLSPLASGPVQDPQQGLEEGGDGAGC